VHRGVYFRNFTSIKGKSEYDLTDFGETWEALKLDAAKWNTYLTKLKSTLDGSHEAFIVTLR